MSYKVIISGPAGSGKSTVMKEVAAALEAEVADIGQEFRKMAVEHGMTADEFVGYLKDHPELDREMDDRFARFLQEASGSVVTSWRMGFHFVPDALSVWLDVAPEEGAKRVFEAERGSDEASFETVADAQRVNLERMQTLRDNLKAVYDVDFTDTSKYGLVIDTTDMHPGEVVAAILDYVCQ